MHINQRINQAKRKAATNPLPANKSLETKHKQLTPPNSNVFNPTAKQNIPVVETNYPIKIQIQEGQEIILQKQIHTEKVCIVGKLPIFYLQAKFCEKFNGFSRELILPVYGEPALLNLENLAKQNAAWYRQHMHIYLPEKKYSGQGFVYIGDWGLMGGGNSSSKKYSSSSGSNHTHSSGRHGSSSNSNSSPASTNSGSNELSSASTSSRPPIYSSRLRSSIPIYHPYTEYLPYQHPLYTPPHYSIHPAPFRQGLSSHVNSNSFTHIPYSFVPVGRTSQEDSKISEEENTIATMRPTHTTTSTISLPPPAAHSGDFTHIPYSLNPVDNSNQEDSNSYEEVNTISSLTNNIPNCIITDSPLLSRSSSVMYIPYSFISPVGDDSMGSFSEIDKPPDVSKETVLEPTSKQNFSSSSETDQAKKLLQEAIVGEPIHFLEPAPCKPKDIKMEVEPYLKEAKKHDNKEEKAEKSKLLSKLNQLKEKEKAAYQSIYNSYAIGENSEIGDKALLDRLGQKDQEIHSLQALEDQLKAVNTSKQSLQPAAATKETRTTKKISSKITDIADQVQSYLQESEKDSDKEERILKGKAALRQVEALKKEEVTAYEDAQRARFFNRAEVGRQGLENQLSERKQNLGYINSLAEDLHASLHIPYRIPESVDGSEQIEPSQEQEAKFAPMDISEATDVSQSSLDFIAKHEGCHLKVYKDIAGLETIGYGHLIKPGENFSNSITDEEALELLRKDAKEAVDAVKRYVTVQLTQNQFDALVSFTFNVGGGALKRSTLLKLVNAGNIENIKDAFLMWNKAKVGGQLRAVKGLTIRREKEASLFLNGLY